MRSRFRLPIMLLGLLLVTSGSGAWARPIEADLVNRQMSAVLPEYRDALEDQIDTELSRYMIEAEFFPAGDDELGSISGDLRIDWVNPADVPANEILFRLYSNDPRYGEGAMNVEDVEVDGVEIDPSYELDDTLMVLRLDEPVAAGGHATISMEFEALIPSDTLSGFGMFNHDSWNDAYTLDHWFPLLSGYDPINGFDTAPVNVNGDPVFTNVAWFEITLTRDSKFVLASTGVVESEESSDGSLTQTLISGPTRNFTMALSEHYGIATGHAGDVEVRSYYLPDHEVRGEESVTWAINAIELFNDLIGPYPYEQFSIVDAELGAGAAGIEFPQIVYMASSYYEQPLGEDRFPYGQENTLVHEVLHQWFYGIVGNNQHQHAFLDESLTNYLTNVYFEFQYGEDVGFQQGLLNLLAPYVIYLHGMPDQDVKDEPVNTPSDSFSTSRAYGVIIYSKGPLAMQAFREALGDDAFFAALSAYFSETAFRIAQPDDLLAAFAAEAPAELDFQALWQHWIEEANGVGDFPAELLEEILALLRGS